MDSTVCWQVFDHFIKMHHRVRADEAVAADRGGLAHIGWRVAGAPVAAAGEADRTVAGVREQHAMGRDLAAFAEVQAARRVDQVERADVDMVADVEALRALDMRRAADARVYQPLPVGMAPTVEHARREERSADAVQPFADHAVSAFISIMSVGANVDWSAELASA